MDKKSGILVQLYHDVDIDPAVSQVHVQDYGKKFFAEELVLLGCKEKKIGPSGFYLFGLVKTNDLKQWLPPNKEVICTEEILHEYTLRIRFIPSMEGIQILVRECKEALAYFFLQCRNDFVQDKIRMSNKVGQEHILGLGVVDMLRWGKETNLNLNQLKKVEPKKFIPSSSKKLFKYPWDSKRLSVNFNNELEKLDKHDEVSIAESKLRYINGFFKYTDQYGIEKFEINDHKDVIVDPKHENYSGIYLVRKPKGTEEAICTIQDVMSIQARQENSLWRVTISRKNGAPKILHFSDEDCALSFASVVDGYHRLIEDFHYHVCPEVFSPMLKGLSKLKCHGPVKRSWAENRIMQKHMKQESFNYLLRQNSKDYECYCMSYIIQQTKQKPELKSLVIIRNENGKWQFNFQNAKTFDTVASLLQFYRKKDNDPNIALSRYVPPTTPLDSTIYLCRESIRNEDSEDASTHDLKSPVALISGINESVTKEVIVMGQFTILTRQLWDKDQNELRKVAVKTLQSKYSPQYLCEFMESMHRVTFWKCPTLIAINAICLNPFQVVLEDSGKQGTLEDWLKNCPVSEDEYVGIADQVAQALRYIHESVQEHSGTNCGYHGNVRTRNVLIFKNPSESDDKNLKVKLGDPGMLSLYNKFQLDHPINEERLPWIAPELYSPTVNLSANNHYSDVYSFGVFLWELYSGGERPFKSLNLKQTMKAVLFDKPGLTPPEQCSQLEKDLIRLCLNVNVEERPSMKEISRELGKIIHECSGSHNMYNQAVSSSGMYNWDSYDGDQSDMPNESEQSEHIDNIFMQSRMSSSDIGNTSQIMESKSPESVPPSPATSSVASFGPWDSRQPLIQQSSGVSSVPPRSYSQQDSFDANASGASRATTSTMLSYGEAASDEQPADSPFQQRPLPDRPSNLAHRATKLPLQDLSHIINPNRLVVKEKVLGKGHYGVVLEAEHELISKETQKVAVKSLKAEMYNRFHSEFDRECKMMTGLEHPNIVQVFGLCSEKENHTTLLVMEYVENGCLRDYLAEKSKSIKKSTEGNTGAKLAAFKKQLPELHRFNYEISQGMIYLSEQKIVHRDLAARNVLVSADIHMKISDFGLARVLGNDKDYYSMSDQKQEIPVYWCAPESIEKKTFSVKSDVWSYGVTMWEIYEFGNAPKLCKVYSLLHVLNVYNERLKKPDLCPKQVYDNIMLQCWEKLPERRLSFGDIDTRLKQYEAEKYNPGKLVVRLPTPSKTSVPPPMFTTQQRPPNFREIKQPQEHSSPSSAESVKLDNNWHVNPVVYPQISLHQSQVVDANLIGRKLPELPKLRVNLEDNKLLPENIKLSDKQLGKGHYGIVVKGTYKYPSGKTVHVAIKLLNSKMVNEVKHQKEFIQECELMSKLEHPNIAQMKGQCDIDIPVLDPKSKGDAPMIKVQKALVMEYVDKGCLVLYLRKQMKVLKEKIAELNQGDDIETKKKALIQSQKNMFKTFLIEIAQGMKYLHCENILHRDLAARNVLVTADNHMKISDFGLSRLLDPEQDYYKMRDDSQVIPVYWSAPETIEHRRYTTKTDVWSYGVVMWEVYMFGLAPELVKPSGLLLAYLQSDNRLPNPDYCSPEIYKDIMMACWKAEPMPRPSFDDILEKFSTLESV